MSHFPRLQGRRVQHPDVGAAVRVLIGKIIDAIAVPHRRGVGAGPARQLFELLRIEVVGEDLLSEAAVVALPGAEVSKDAVVGDRVAVGPVAHQADRTIDRHAGRQPARDGDLIEVLDPAVPLIALGQIDDVLRVRCPGDHHVVRPVAASRAGLGRRMEGQALRGAALRQEPPKCPCPPCSPPCRRSTCRPGRPAGTCPGPVRS